MNFRRRYGPEGQGMKRIAASLATLLLMLGIMHPAMAITNRCQRELTAKKQLSDPCTRQVILHHAQRLNQVRKSLHYAKQQKNQRFFRDASHKLRHEIKRFNERRQYFDNNVDNLSLQLEILKLQIATEVTAAMINGAKDAFADEAVEHSQKQLLEIQQLLIDAQEKRVEQQLSARQAAVSGSSELGQTGREQRRFAMSQQIIIDAQNRANQAVAAKHEAIMAAHRKELEAAKASRHEASLEEDRATLGIIKAGSVASIAETKKTVHEAGLSATTSEYKAVKADEATDSASTVSTLAARVSDASGLVASLAGGRFSLEEMEAMSSEDPEVAAKLDVVREKKAALEAAESTLSLKHSAVLAAAPGAERDAALREEAEASSAVDMARIALNNATIAAKDKATEHVDALRREHEAAEAILATKRADLEEAKRLHAEALDHAKALAADVDRLETSAAAATDLEAIDAAKMETAAAIREYNAADAVLTTATARLNSATASYNAAAKAVGAATVKLEAASAVAAKEMSQQAKVTEKTPRAIPPIRRFDLHDCTRRGDYEEGTWCGFIEPGLYQQSGNSDVLQFSIDSAATQRKGKWEYGAVADLNYIRTNGRVTDDTYWGGVEVKYHYCPRGHIYDEMLYESKQMRGYKHIFANTIGVSHDYVRDERFAFSAGIGVGVRNSLTTDNVDQTDFTQELRAQFSAGLTPKMSVDQLFLADFGNFGDSLSTKSSVTTVTTKLTHDLSINYSLRLDHMSQVPAGKRTLDAIGKVSLRYDF